ncbi:hypothetical protein [Pseudomonas sp. ODNR1LW]|jgi:hypothetical protein|nr:hypothetical protein [Pseudomonas sp. ODNR1LW]
MRIKSLLACAGVLQSQMAMADALATLAKALYPSAQVQAAGLQTTERNR